MSQSTDGLWRPGDVVVFRLVETPTTVRMLRVILGDPALAGGQPFLAGGRIVSVVARPYRVVLDTPELAVLYQPEGTLLPRWLIDEQRYFDQPQRTRGQTLRLLYPDKGYDITLMFDGNGESPWFYKPLFDGAGLAAGWREGRDALAAETSAPATPGRFRGWYINMLSTVRTPYGFDAVDQTLDIVVRPDRSWYWKDEDELAAALAEGACSIEYAAAIRAAGEEVVRLIEARVSPFDDTWTSWHAPEGWAIDAIPDGWQTSPAILELTELGK